MWLVIITFLTLQIHAVNQYLLFGDHVLSHEEKLFFWRFENLEIQLSVGAACGFGEGMRWWDGETERIQGRFPLSGKGHWAHWERLPASITRESDTVWWWYPEQKIGYENSVRYKISLPEMKLPSPRTDPSSSASPGLNRRAHWAVSAIVSLASHPFLCIPELDTIQWMKNSTIMNQNKRALSHLVFFSLFPPNANDCVCSC